MQCGDNDCWHNGQNPGSCLGRDETVTWGGVGGRVKVGEGELSVIRNLSLYKRPPSLLSVIERYDGSVLDSELTAKMTW